MDWRLQGQDSPDKRMNDVVHRGMKSGQEMDVELLHAVFSFHKLTAVMKQSNDSKTKPKKWTNKKENNYDALKFD